MVADRRLRIVGETGPDRITTTVPRPDLGGAADPDPTRLDTLPAEVTAVLPDDRSRSIYQHASAHPAVFRLVTLDLRLVRRW